jgi:hypothetical protein
MLPSAKTSAQETYFIHCFFMRPYTDFNYPKYKTNKTLKNETHSETKSNLFRGSHLHPPRIACPETINTSFFTGCTE